MREQSVSSWWTTRWNVGPTRGNCRAWLLVGCAGIGWVAGCAGPSPFDADDGAFAQGRLAVISVERALGDRPGSKRQLDPAARVGEVERALAGRLDELDALGPATGDHRFGRDAGPALLDVPMDIVAIDRERALGSALTRNLALGAVRLEPRLRAEDVLIAEAVFDTVLFADAGYNRSDGSLIPGGSGLTRPASETWRFGTGIRKRFEAGTQVDLSTTLDRFRVRGASDPATFNPLYDAALRLGVTQPLLRGFGNAVNTAAIRLADNRLRAAQAGVRTDLESVALRTEETYWSLAQAWHELAIAEWLVEVGIEVRDVLERRQEFDTRPAEFADAVARVEQRRADVIRAQFAVRQLSDQLKALMNDPELPLAAETLLRPEELADVGPISFDLRDLVTQAITYRPEIEQSRFAILDASIRLGVAGNLRLPTLNLRAEVAYFGLDDGAGSAYEEAFSFNDVDYVLALAFEYPLGNRAADAEERLARLSRTQSMIRYRNVVQDVVLEVKNASRLLMTSVELLRASRSFRIAQSENLRALLVREEQIAGLTPEFLNLKFQRQDQLALARRQEFGAMADLRRAVAGLDRATGRLLESRGFDVDAMVTMPVGRDLEEIDGLRR